VRRSVSEDSGFALVEAICALVLAALIMMTISLATSLVARSSDRATESLNALEMMAGGLMRLRSDVASTLPVLTEPTGESPLLFSGSSGSLGLAIAGSDTEPEAVVWIEPRYDAGGGRLLRWERPLGPGDPSFDALRSRRAEVLLSGPWIYQFSYGRRSKDKGVLWAKTWLDRTALPDFIRLDILTNGPERRSELAMVSSTHVDAQFDCIQADGTCMAREAQPAKAGEVDAPAK